MLSLPTLVHNNNNEGPIMNPIWQRVILIFLLFSISLPAFSMSKPPTGHSHKQFIADMLEATEQNNQSILKQRKHLLALQQQHQKQQPLSASQQQWLNKLAKSYKLNNPDFTKASTWSTLTQRVDVIPASLVIAQAANESAWGKSRFAKQANNYFGQWCSVPGCGIVPKQRSHGARHEVKKFSSLQASIAGYMKNLNTHTAYASLRHIRAQERQKQQIPSGYAMAAGLTRYSGLGSAYVRAIRSIIKKYHLQQYDSLVA